MFCRTPAWDRDWCNVILDIVTTLTAISRDQAAARALPHPVISNSYCTDGVHFVGEDDSSSTLPIKCMSRPWLLVKVTPMDAATLTWLCLRGFHGSLQVNVDEIVFTEKSMPLSAWTASTDSPFTDVRAAFEPKQWVSQVSISSS